MAQFQIILVKSAKSWVSPYVWKKKGPEFSLTWCYSWSLQFLLSLLEPKDGVHVILSSTAIRTRCATAQTSAAGLQCCKGVVLCPTAMKSWTKLFFSELPSFWVILAVTLLGWTKNRSWNTSELSADLQNDQCRSGPRFNVRVCLWPPSSEYTVVNHSWDRGLPTKSYTML